MTWSPRDSALTTVVLLPVVCFGLVVLLDLPALLGIGMLLLAASPGGTTANLFSPSSVVTWRSTSRPPPSTP